MNESEMTIRQALENDRTDITAPVIDTAIPRIEAMGISVDVPGATMSKSDLNLVVTIIDHVVKELGVE